MKVRVPVEYVAAYSKQIDLLDTAPKATIAVSWVNQIIEDILTALFTEYEAKADELGL